VSRRTGAELAADHHLGLVYFVSFIPYHLCGGSAKGWFIRTLRDIAVPANHFFASFDSNGPLRVLRIPGDFHSFYPHDILQILLCIIALTGQSNFEACDSLSGAARDSRSSIALSHGRVAVAEGRNMADISDIERISAKQAREKAHQALLVCAYENEVKHRMLNLDGSVSLANFRSRLASLPKTQEIIFY